MDDESDKGTYASGGRGTDVIPEMVEAGCLALVEGRSAGKGDAELVLGVYRAMAAARPAWELGPNFEEFARETIFNIRGLIESASRCERRASEYARKVGVSV